MTHHVYLSDHKGLMTASKVHMMCHLAAKYPDVLGECSLIRTRHVRAVDLHELRIFAEAQFIIS